jgi:hypothetical protein
MENESNTAPVLGINEILDLSVIEKQVLEIGIEQS